MSSQRPIIDANTICGFWATRQMDISPEALARVMQQGGVVRYLAVSTTGIFHDYRAGNDETLNLAQQFQGMVPVATVDPRQYVDCFSELERRSEQGFSLFRLFPDLQGYPLNFSPLQDVLAKLNELGKPVMIPAPQMGDATMLAEKVAFNQTPVILTSVSCDNLGEALSVMKSCAQIYLESHLLNSPDAFEVIVSEVGPDRIVFGSNAPLRYFASSYLSVTTAGVSDNDRANILGGNIRRVLAAKTE